jgi:hypothetical protein
MLGVESRLFDLHTSLPGIVESFDASKNTVNVQPALIRVYETGEEVQLPIINQVPIVYPSGMGGKCSITFPLTAGDSVFLIFSERSLDNWKQKGGVVDPVDPRKFNLTDAVAIPGANPFTSPLKVDPANLVISNGETQIILEPSGMVKFTNGTNELVDLISQTLYQLSIAQTAVGPLLNADQFAQLLMKLNTLKGT